MIELYLSRILIDEALGRAVQARSARLARPPKPLASRAATHIDRANMAQIQAAARARYSPF